MPLVEERWRELDREEIIRKFMSMEFNRFLDYYRNAPDLNLPERKGSRRNAEHRPEPDSAHARGSRRNPHPEDAQSAAPDDSRNRRSNESRSDSPEDRDDRTRTEDKGFSWIRITAGARSSVTPRRLLRMLTTLGIGRKGIGRIQIQKDSSYFQIADRAVEYVIQQTDGSMYRGKRIRTTLLPKNR